MVDLHTHTTYSDGDKNLKELLIEAEKNNVTTLSITDHDTVDAYDELNTLNYKGYYTGRIIPGAEFNVIFNNAKIELLGYDFDIEKIKKFCKNTYTKNAEYMDMDKEFKLMMEICHKNGIIVDDLIYDKSMGWPIDIIHPSIKRHEENRKLFTEKEWNDTSYFFRCCTCNLDFPLFIDLSNQMPNAKIVSDAIREAGGKVFLAHLYLYPLKDHIAYLDKLVSENIIDGIEVYHSKFTSDESKILECYAKDHNLLISGGTDYHGDKKVGRLIGSGYGNINITEDMISWIGKYYNKLVRDNIPEIIKNNGELPITTILDDNSYKKELENKLYEEYLEVIESSGKERIEELADMLEIIKALAKLENSSLEEVIEVSNEKVKKRGAFDKKIYLEKVIKK